MLSNNKRDKQGDDYEINIITDLDFLCQNRQTTQNINIKKCLLETNNFSDLSKIY